MSADAALDAAWEVYHAAVRAGRTVQPNALSDALSLAEPADKPHARAIAAAERVRLRTEQEVGAVKGGQVVSLAAAREARADDGGDHLACDICGGVWWRTSVVIDKTTMSVTGYDAAIVCCGCDEQDPS